MLTEYWTRALPVIIAVLAARHQPTAADRGTAHRQPRAHAAAGQRRGRRRRHRRAEARLQLLVRRLPRVRRRAAHFSRAPTRPRRLHAATAVVTSAPLCASASPRRRWPAPSARLLRTDADCRGPAAPLRLRRPTHLPLRRPDGRHHPGIITVAPYRHRRQPRPGVLTPPGTGSSSPRRHRAWTADRSAYVRLSAPAEMIAASLPEHAPRRCRARLCRAGPDALPKQDKTLPLQRKALDYGYVIKNKTRDLPPSRHRRRRAHVVHAVHALATHARAGP